MGDNLYMQNGKASMFYVGDPPWHRLGTKLDNPATALQAIEAAGLNWEVTKQPIYAGHMEPRHQIDNLFAMMPGNRLNKPSCPVFGIVSGSYTPLQNCEAFEFFDPIVGKGAAIYHTAGALGNGERIWILAKLPSDIHVIGGDISHKYLLLSNSHDGQGSVQIKFTPIRVVCQNTLTMALRRGPTIRVSHTRDLHERLKNAERTLGLINRRFEDIGTSFRAMTRVKMSSERLSEYLNLVFPNPPDPENTRTIERIRRNRAFAEHLFANGKGTEIRGVAGTLWAAYNGVTEFIDHRGPSHSKHLDSIWFGDGYFVKARAFMIAESKINSWIN